MDMTVSLMVIDTQDLLTTKESAFSPLERSPYFFHVYPSRRLPNKKAAKVSCLPFTA